MAKKTTQEFIEKATLIHGDKYDYSKSIYTGAKIKVIITCRAHGDFLQIARTHLEGNIGCKKCYQINRTTSFDDFINEATKIHGNKYDYSKSNWVNVTTKILIICPLHGEFLQRPNTHLTTECLHCSFRTRTGKNSKSLKVYYLDDFKELANEIHGNKYNYSKVKIEHFRKNIIIICDLHGDFSQTPNNHLKGRGCYQCLNCKYDEKRRSLDDFIKEANIVHNFKYNYSESEYINSYTNITVICETHGSFLQTPVSHLRGSDCPKCVGRISKIETIWLNYLNVPFEKRQITLIIDGRNYLADAFDSENNSIYEFYGDFWHGNPNKYNPEEINIKNKQTFGCLYQKTLERESKLKNAGYNLITIWEDDFRKSEFYKNRTKKLND